ncbi:glycosyltransferase [Paenibacillus aurantiacus]|uniref:Glycosyltransferase n=1 Tax=Paenibacillus aurantiacus TaxID=1936118 RepID=A0ABV5KH25_9BACL
MEAGAYEYDRAFYNIASHRHESTAILVVAYNRPAYLEQVIACIERNPESATLPFFFFLDGGTGATQEENSALIQRANITNKYIITRPRNYGCAKNLIDARRFAMDWCGYERMIVIEDDILLTPHYIRHILALHDWAKQNYSRVGVVQSWSYCFLDREDKLGKLHLVQTNSMYWWSFVSYCMDREAWMAIRPYLYHYETFIDQIPLTEDYDIQRSKPGRSPVGPAIRAWVKGLIETTQHDSANDDQQAKVQLDMRSQFAEIDYNITSQDLMTGFALWMTGYVRLETVVNRVKHIGMHGVTVDETLFHNFRMHQISLDSFDQDALLTDFVEL